MTSLEQDGSKPGRHWSEYAGVGGILLLAIAVVSIVCLLIVQFAGRYSAYLFGIFGVVILSGLVRAAFRRRRDLRRGWRVGHAGRDAMYYEEFRDGAWQRIDIDGEMLMGKAHSAIYFDSIELPDWAAERRDEIIGRIKSEFRQPRYEYHDG